ncbi:hypothetical protein N8Z24_00005 [bacterium]|nr:hypothetical protein [bacterium]
MLSKEEIILLFLSSPGALATATFHGNIEKSDKMRELICSFNNPLCAFYYAYFIDTGPHDLTRKVCCLGAREACDYAFYVDKEPREDTRIGAFKSDYWKLRYLQCQAEKRFKNSLKKK